MVRKIMLHYSVLKTFGFLFVCLFCLPCFELSLMPVGRLGQGSEDDCAAPQKVAIAINLLLRTEQRTNSKRNSFACFFVAGQYTDPM